jgi:hypothetical protein
MASLGSGSTVERDLMHMIQPADKALILDLQGLQAQEALGGSRQRMRTWWGTFGMCIGYMNDDTPGFFALTLLVQ